MPVSREEINVIVQEVLKNLQGAGLTQASDKPSPATSGPRGRGVFDTMDDAVKAAGEAQKKLTALPLSTRRAMIDNMRRRALEKLEELARLGVEDTGYGRVADKIQKNKLAITRTPGMEDLQPVSYSFPKWKAGRPLKR